MAPYIISIGALKQESRLYPAEVDYALQQLKKEEEVEKTTKSSTKKRKAESELVREDKGERICLFKRTLRFVNTSFFFVLFFFNIRYTKMLANGDLGY